MYNLDNVNSILTRLMSYIYTLEDFAEYDEDWLKVKEAREKNDLSLVSTHEWLQYATSMNLLCRKIDVMFKEYEDKFYHKLGYSTIDDTIYINLVSKYDAILDMFPPMNIYIENKDKD